MKTIGMKLLHHNVSLDTVTLLAETAACQEGDPQALVPALIGLRVKRQKA
jgi:hypothetical protein